MTRSPTFPFDSSDFPSALFSTTNKTCLALSTPDHFEMTQFKLYSPVALNSKGEETPARDIRVTVLDVNMPLRKDGSRE